MTTILSEETLIDIFQAFANSGDEPELRTLEELASCSGNSLLEIIRFHDRARIKALEFPDTSEAVNQG